MSTAAAPAAKAGFPWMWAIIITLLALGLIVGYVVYRNRNFLNAPAIDPGAGKTEQSEGRPNSTKEGIAAAAGSGRG